MDKGKICKIRDIYRAISELDTVFARDFGVSINEAMVLCVLLDRQRLTAGEIAEQLGATMSNASKIMRSVETKGLARRALGKDDHRQMFFSLTPAGRTKIEAMKVCEMPLPSILEEVL